MYRNYLMIVFVLGCLGSIAQEKKDYKVTFDATVPYIPSTSYGAEASLQVKIIYDVFFGEPTKMAMAKATKVEHFWYNGTRYHKSDVDEKTWNSIKQIGNIDVEADIYQGSYKVATVRYTDLISMDAKGSPNWDRVFPGATAEEAKEVFRKGFRIVNPRITSLSWDGKYSVEKFFEDKRKGEDYDRLIQEGDAHFGSAHYEEALTSYEGARSNKRTEELDQKIENTKTKLDELELDEKYQEIIDLGDEAFNSKDYDSAESEYNRAIALKETEQYPKDQLVEIDRLIEEMKKEEAATQANLEDEEEVDDEEVGESEGGQVEDDVEEEQKTDDEAVESDNEQQPGNSSISDEDRARQEEYDRLQRQQDFYSRVNQQQQQNAQLAGEAAAGASVLIYYLGKAMYGGIGNDRDINFFKGTSIRFRALTGFSITSMPMYTNSSYEFFDGNTTTSTDETKNFQTGTIDVNGGAEFWPLYSEKFGIGAYGMTSFGFSLDNWKVGVEYGIRLFGGAEKIKLYGEFVSGARRFSHTPWFDPLETGGSVNKHTFYKFGIGPRFSWNTNWSGKTVAHLDIYPVFEMPNFRHASYTISNSPVNIRWTKGFKANLSFDNRMQIFIETLWDYDRNNNQKYNFDSEATPAGVLVQFGALRSIDIFGNSVYAQDYETSSKLSNRLDKMAISFGKMMVSWFDPYANGTFLLGGYKTGIVPISFEMDKNFSRAFSVFAGAQLSLGSGSILRPKTGETLQIGNFQYTGPVNFKVGTANIHIPVGLRVSTILPNNNIFWVKGGLAGNLKISETQREQLSLPSIEWDLLDEEEILKRFTPSSLVGLGMDFHVGGESMIRFSIEYNNYLKSMHVVEGSPLNLKTIEFGTGIIF